MFFHIADPTAWREALASGYYTMSTRGRTLGEEGFIHASYAHQVRAVAKNVYGDVDEDVVLLEIDPDFLTPIVEVKEEPAAPDHPELFPHIYGPLPVAAVRAAHPAHITHGILETEAL